MNVGVNKGKEESTLDVSLSGNKTPLDFPKGKKERYKKHIYGKVGQFLKQK